MGSVTPIRVLGHSATPCNSWDLTKRLSLHSMAKGLAPGRRGERLRWVLAVLLYAAFCWGQEVPTPSNLLPSYEGQHGFYH